MGSESPATPERKVLSWAELQARCRAVADEVAKPPGVQCVAGVPRGGLVPAAIIAERLRLPLVSIDAVEALGRRVLVVDDLIDSGATAARFVDRCAFVALFRKPWSPFQECASFTVDRWLVFPWEVDAGEAPAVDAVLRLLQVAGLDTTGVEGVAAELVDFLVGVARSELLRRTERPLPS